MEQPSGVLIGAGPRKTIRCPKCNRGLRPIRRDRDGIVGVTNGTAGRYSRGGVTTLVYNVPGESADGRRGRKEVKYSAAVTDASPDEIRGKWIVVIEERGQRRVEVVASEVEAWRLLASFDDNPAASAVTLRAHPLTRYRFRCEGDRHRFDRIVSQATLERLYEAAIIAGGDVVLPL